jgi:hypothetical protein
MAACAGEIQARLTQLQAFQERTGEIALAVRDLTEFAKDAHHPREILERLGPVEDRIAGVHKEARAEEFDDVAHEISALREMLAGMRRKLEGR